MHTLRVDRASPAQLGSDRDFASSLGLAHQKPRRLILINHQQRHAEPACRVLNSVCLLAVIERVKVRTKCEPCHVAARMQVENHVHPRPDIVANKRGDAVRDAGERLSALAFDESSIQIHAIVGGAFRACPREMPPC